ncbi:hypothetical protein CALCODRAFT_521952 [Calocera cornea HHB12733]|uniref:Uncharacterized protein n=1 Tax=Calocera cornea HHB12733 TaxID=1353952 RepID=A0A165C9V6_9BASI|nr:hypothetical protein CALCODRAFT_521952 [Calocera cornea HHB12733]
MNHNPTSMPTVGRAAGAMAPDNPSICDGQSSDISSAKVDREVPSCAPRSVAARLRGGESIHPGGPAPDPGSGVGNPAPASNRKPSSINNSRRTGAIPVIKNPAPPFSIGEGSVEANGIINLFLLMEANPNIASHIAVSHASSGDSAHQASLPVSNNLQLPSAPSYDAPPAYEPIAPLVYQRGNLTLASETTALQYQDNRRAGSSGDGYFERRFEEGRKAAQALKKSAPSVGLAYYDEAVKVIDVLKTWFNFFDVHPNAAYTPLSNSDPAEWPPKDKKAPAPLLSPL